MAETSGVQLPGLEIPDDIFRLFHVGRVVRTEPVTSRMRRVTISSEAVRDLGDEPDPFVACRLYFPPPGEETPRLPSSLEDLALTSPLAKLARPWTIRRIDRDRLEFDLDFVLHDHDGVGINWVRQAKEGDQLGFVFPALAFPAQAQGTQIPTDVDCNILVGDEPAIPGFATIVEHLGAGNVARVFLEVVDEADEQPLTSNADLDVRWLHRREARPGTTDLLLDAVRDMEWPEGRVHVLINAESKLVGAVRRFLREERGLDRTSYLAVPMWRSGTNFEDQVVDLVATAEDYDL